MFGWSDGERREIDDHHTLQLVDVATATGAWNTMRDVDAPAAPEDLSNALDCNPIARHSLDAFSPSA
ncbi:hypothetical protein E3O47_07120 [Cryobacterium sp. TMT2-17-1]|uniref:hypothetical protein n=1 Tax=unclassified Cryobacterium TaxID=2649013 RepID=UPI00106D1338|nr:MULTISPECIES: hypothetical protein [unclassified Cryobacterium]TFB53287.1 hypothetical protein E3N94_15015 [Cryobacterium sp. Sr3]TFC35161.1 hypothetical protein E3O28_10565 [Cryobacterium sp. TMT2-14]TFC51495.1 hypothetical protein E3O47_07120 [Cryobacterium sp. TMT2-17-1]